ncbi:uncharacterized protein PG998_008694 [Apiospora kogelbergensis]|uniref:uncharacterized protein n=1 Tax=Apiospora kogelbergensis TaxID=1337665 RepID=UPI00313140EA
MIVATSLTAVWLTINPNDINNPFKLNLYLRKKVGTESSHHFLIKAERVANCLASRPEGALVAVSNASGTPIGDFLQF